MTRWRKRLLIAAGIAAVVICGLVIAAVMLARRYEPFIRQQAIEYLEKRFDSRVEIAGLKVHLPTTSPIRLVLTRGRNALGRVEGSGIVVRYRGRRDIPPMLSIGKLEFGVDLGTLFESRKRVPFVNLDQLQIAIPPKGERPGEGSSSSSSGKTGVVVERVEITRAQLTILPKDVSRKPLDFHIERLRLESAGTDVAMKYNADLTNPKPPGRIRSSGSFGPWNTAEPGDTPLSGDYTFDNADLGVFDAIAGILKSTGKFKGTLDSVDARGEASIPDFRLKTAGNPVPLWTRFEVLVDGTNGNTVLKPVVAKLGSTNFTTTGGVIRHEGERRKAINLVVNMPHGNMRDVLRLAMKGPPFMEGQIALRTRIDIPPLSSRVKDKLRLDGRFNVLQGHFLRVPVQDKVDAFSRRAQGRPDDLKIDEVFSRMTGAFHLENQVLLLRNLEFEIPGANVHLGGNLNLGSDQLDLRGTLKMKARVSQTMTGWKRWALKPVDPFFAKKGAGTFLKIHVEGSSKEPKFGLDR
jgi:hypothetical protein